MNAHWITPVWDGHPRVRALATTRSGGGSAGPWGLAEGRAGGLNLGSHCGDDPVAVQLNRARLRAALPAEPIWLQQVHGVVVADADQAAARGGESVADASVASVPGIVCAVMTADCLPVLLAARDGSAVAAAHAGWRGLCGGVIENAVEALRARTPTGASIAAWLGAAIGPSAFEVGSEVRERFCDAHAAASDAFVPASEPGKWLADLYALARMRLALAGVERVSGGGLCTVSDSARFYSFRRDHTTGRMASCVWIEADR